MISDDETNYEVQVSAFTEAFKTIIIQNSTEIDDLQEDFLLQSTSIATINGFNATQRKLQI